MRVCVRACVYIIYQHANMLLTSILVGPTLCAILLFYDRLKIAIMKHGKQVNETVNNTIKLTDSQIRVIILSIRGRACELPHVLGL